MQSKKEQGRLRRIVGGFQYFLSLFQPGSATFSLAGASPGSSAWRSFQGVVAYRLGPIASGEGHSPFQGEKQGLKSRKAASLRKQPSLFKLKSS